VRPTVIAHRGSTSTLDDVPARPIPLTPLWFIRHGQEEGDRTEGGHPAAARPAVRAQRDHASEPRRASTKEGCASSQDADIERVVILCVHVILSVRSLPAVSAAASKAPAAQLFSLDTAPAASGKKQHQPAKKNAAAGNDLFSIDTTPSAVGTAAAKKHQLKRKRDEETSTATADAGGAKKKKTGASPNTAAAKKSAQNDDDAMDTSDTGAATTEAPYFHDSDDEQVGYVTRDRRQLRAHKPHAAKLVASKEVSRLERAVETKKQKEAAASAAKTPLFDLWATTLEDDLKKGIVPATDEKGFRVARTQQSRFRHRGAGTKEAQAHIAPSVLPSGIREGASFHPDEGEHQKLLREAWEKDEKEREEQRKIHARFHPRAEDGTLVSSTTGAAAAGQEEKKPAEEDSWMEDAEPIKGPTPSNKKYSQTERNRMARAAENREKEDAKRSEKELGKFVQRIPVLVAQWKKEEKVKAREKQRVAQLKETHPDRKPKLGPHVETELFPEVALTEDLPEHGALRAIQPSRHVLEEQFARFQQRHLIETRKRVKPTKGNGVRTYERFKEQQPMTAPTAKGTQQQ
jgi:hypothetical protein